MRTTVDLWGKIESLVQTILEDVDKRHPNTVVELMRTNGSRKGNMLAMPITSYLSAASKALRNEATAFELLRASLGVIFQERYCWTDERIDEMTLPEVFIALEHAMEYDAPSKKSVWDL
jgi:hypothetical protein